ncbi:MAG: MBL fold metallo-hydrolase [Micrococcales bacterium]|nr:MBL fold metallo-hydrolase [Micrococcales bacterium]
MKLLIVGCSGSFAGPESPASCYVVTAEHEGRTWRVALDFGSGALGAMQRHLDPMALDAVVLSHLHPDHCLDLCGLKVMRCYNPVKLPDAVLPVYAPVGAAERLARAYGVEAPEPLGPYLDFREIGAREPIVIGPFVITPVPVRHPVQAYGLRVQADGAVLAYTGDTDLCDELSELCVDADLVLADCAFVDGRDDAKVGVHMSGSRAARAVVRATGVRRLMLTHLPTWNDPDVCREQAETVWPGVVEMAQPGVTYEV